MWRDLLQPSHLLIVGVLVVVLFGWKKLPDAARSVGRSMRIFKSEVSEMKNDGKEGRPSPAASDTVPGGVVPPPAQPAQPGQPTQAPYAAPAQPPYAQTPPAEPQYSEPQYSQPQYSQPQAQPQYTQPQSQPAPQPERHDSANPAL
jgi:sec-independent protein translocase protein TatA